MQLENARTTRTIEETLRGAPPEVAALWSRRIKPLIDGEIQVCRMNFALISEPLNGLTLEKCVFDFVFSLTADKPGIPGKIVDDFIRVFIKGWMSAVEAAKPEEDAIEP